MRKTLVFLALSIRFAGDRIRSSPVCGGSTGRGFSAVTYRIGDLGPSGLEVSCSALARLLLRNLSGAQRPSNAALV